MQARGERVVVDGARLDGATVHGEGAVRGRLLRLSRIEIVCRGRVGAALDAVLTAAKNVLVVARSRVLAVRLELTAAAGAVVRERRLRVVVGVSWVGAATKGARAVVDRVVSLVVEGRGVGAAREDWETEAIVSVRRRVVIWAGAVGAAEVEVLAVSIVLSGSGPVVESERVHAAQDVRGADTADGGTRVIVLSGRVHAASEVAVAALERRC